jgi:hypothetical protein
MKIKDLKKLSDGELAGNQAQYDPNSRPWKVNELEFKRRERWRNVVPSMLLVALGFFFGLIPWLIDKLTDTSIQKVEIINLNELQKTENSNQSIEAIVTTPVD